ncbi:PadR family transcriptional regulator [bacterium]|nr:PadR family transcriptional regulator [bacterium]
MIELLILYVLTRREFTMYGISKEIEGRFDVYTRPSFGALKPALRKLISGGFIDARKSMSEGGKLSVYYSITNDGEKELKKLIKKELSTNPVQFIANAKIKLSAADKLNKEERAELFLHLKTLAISFKNSAENILNDEYTEKNFYQKILLDNSSVVYSNLIKVIEGFEKDNERNG